MGHIVWIASTINWQLCLELKMIIFNKRSIYEFMLHSTYSCFAFASALFCPVPLNGAVSATIMIHRFSCCITEKWKSFEIERSEKKWWAAMRNTQQFIPHIQLCIIGFDFYAFHCVERAVWKLLPLILVSWNWCRAIFSLIGWFFSLAP